MTNNNTKTIYTIISFSAPRLIKDSYNLIASSHYLSVFHKENISSFNLVKRLDMLYDGNLQIVVISNDITEFNSKKISDSISNDFMLFKYPAELFFTKDKMEELLIKNKNINQFIFMFHNRDYGDIVKNFAFFNIIVSGGSNTKKHILSPIQLRLARFLIAILPLTGSNVVNSFHSNREKQTPMFDYTSKEGKEVFSRFTDYKIKVADTKDTDSKGSRSE
jgi:hypothetical protein